MTCRGKLRGGACPLCVSKPLASTIPQEQTRTSMQHALPNKPALPDRDTDGIRMGYGLIRVPARLRQGARLHLPMRDFQTKGPILLGKARLPRPKWLQTWYRMLFLHFLRPSRIQAHCHAVCPPAVIGKHRSIGCLKLMNTSTVSRGREETEPAWKIEIGQHEP